MLNDKKSDTNKINEDHFQSNYYSSITEVNTNTLMDEIELFSTNKNKDDNNNYKNKFKKLNYLEMKKKF